MQSPTVICVYLERTLVSAYMLSDNCADMKTFILLNVKQKKLLWLMIDNLKKSL